jgi:riboflavin kinase/FMN adenylyltransferase
MSIGVRPTFGGQLRTLEVHLVDFAGELYGRDLEVEFVDWLRPELRFEGREPLVAAIRVDVEQARALLAADGPPR